MHKKRDEKSVMLIISKDLSTRVGAHIGNTGLPRTLGAVETTVSLD